MKRKDHQRKSPPKRKSRKLFMMPTEIMTSAGSTSVRTGSRSHSSRSRKKSRKRRAASPGIGDSPLMRALGFQNKTLTGIALATDISLTHASRIFNGSRNPSLKVAFALSQELGISVKRFFEELQVVQKSYERKLARAS